MGQYAHGTTALDPTLLEPMSDREARLRDYNAKHSNWFEGEGEQTKQPRKAAQSVGAGDGNRREGPRKPTRDDGATSPSKIDLVWTTRGNEGVRV